MMFQCLDLLVFTFLLLAAVTTAGQILPPQNLSLRWINEFWREITWDPPPHSMTNCHYDGVKATKPQENISFIPEEATFYIDKDMVMERGFLRYSFRTVCGNNQSKLAVLEISYPELVKNLDCYIYSPEKGHCAWSPAWNTTDLHFFYWLDVHYEETRRELQECSSYNYTGDVKSGCDFPAKTNTIIGILFNATLNNTVVRNSFYMDDLKVKPPAPRWEVIKTKNKFNISWNVADLPRLNTWTFEINYTQCNKEETTIVPRDSTSYVLQRVSHCQYCIGLRAKSDSGNSLPSDKKCFDADKDLYWLVCAVVIFLIVTLAGVTFVCWHRNKDTIWPKIPGPPDFLSDIAKNNNESIFHKLYIPAEEEENCIVTLATDTQTKKPDC